MSNIDAASSAIVFSTQIGKLKNDNDRKKPLIEFDADKKAFIIKGLANHDHHLSLDERHQPYLRFYSNGSLKTHQSIALMIPESTEIIIFLGTDGNDGFKYDRGNHFQVKSPPEQATFSLPNLKQVLVYTGDGTDKVTLQGFLNKNMTATVNPGAGHDDDVFITDFSQAELIRDRESYESYGLKATIKNVDQVDVNLGPSNVQLLEFSHNYIRGGADTYQNAGDNVDSIVVDGSKTLKMTANGDFSLQTNSKVQETIDIDSRADRSNINLDLQGNPQTTRASIKHQGANAKLRNFQSVTMNSTTSYVDLDLGFVDDFQHNAETASSRIKLKAQESSMTFTRPSNDTDSSGLPELTTINKAGEKSTIQISNSEPGSSATIRVLEGALYIR